MGKILSFLKIIILFTFLLSFYNSRLLYAEKNDLDAKKPSKLKIVEIINKNVLVKMEDDVKLSVVFTLSSLADNSDVLFLKQLLKEIKRIDYINRAFCAGALARLGDTSAIDVLLKDLDDKHNSFRLLTAETLGRLNAGDSVAGRYAAKLKGKGLSEIILSIRILGGLSVEKTLPIIIEQTKDINKFVRKEAAIALSDFKNRVTPSVLEALVDLLNDDSEEVRAQAVISLGNLYEKRTLEGILNRDPISDEAKQAFLLSMEHREKAAVELRKHLKDSSNKVKNYVISSLGLLEDGPSAFSIVEEFHNDNALIKQAAARAIGQIKDASVASRLVYLFDDPDKNVQAEAVKAVGLLGDKSLLSEVLKKSGTRDLNLETAVLVAAFQLGDSSVVDKGIEEMEKGDITSKIINTQALGYMVSTEKTIKALNAALNDKDALVRIAAVRSLRLLGSNASLFNIINMLGDKNTEVCIEACAAIKCFEDHRAVEVLRKMLE